MAEEPAWWVYIIEASDGRWYTGVTTDLERRFAEHAGSRQGAKFFNGRKPQRIVYREAASDRSGAQSREAAIKRLTRAEKERLVSTETS